MSRSHRRPSEYSRGSSPRVERTLSVTEASFQNLGLGETAGAQQLPIPSSYPVPDTRRRRTSNLSPAYFPSQYDPSGYHRTASPTSFEDLQSSTAFGTSLLDPEDYQLFPETSDYSERAGPFSSTLSRSAMGAYPYHPDTMSSYRESSSYGTTKSPSQRGYTEASSSRSMSGPSGPSILPSSAYSGFQVEGREIARQRQRNLHESRRQSKLLHRRTVLPSNASVRPSGVDSVSASIDFLTAHSGSSYDSHGAYGRASSTPSTHPTYAPAISASPYQNSYPAPYGTNSIGSSTLYPSPQNPPYTAYGDGRRGSATTSNPEPVVLETPKKPQCWEHGCNGRQFSTFSNLLRHQREKSGTSQKSVCHRCGAEFTRKTARDGHLAHDKCKPRSSS